jgi:hypothetical protein
MRRFMFAAAAGLALAFVAAAPARSQASWLSEALHRRFDPGYYAPPVYSYGGAYYAQPAYDYYAPTYVAPPAVYYSQPYYYGPGTSFYWSSGPRYYGRYNGYRGSWHGDRDGWHGGREHHHR